MASKQLLATPAKQPENGPPDASVLADAISVKNQCPPLSASKSHEGSPPELQPLAVSPITVSSGIAPDSRRRPALKTMSSPMLFASTTLPLPAHRPWSGGSMSPCGLVGSVPLSTAFRPLTPTAPPAEELTVSQPGPCGWQLTVGMTGAAALVALPLVRAALVRGSTGSGMVCCCAALADWRPAACGLVAMDRVDGTRVGPVSREQPAVLQPVAAGPVKVGEDCPRLVDVGWPAPWCPLDVRDMDVAAVAPVVVVSSASGNKNIESSAAVPRSRLLPVGIEPPQ